MALNKLYISTKRKRHTVVYTSKEQCPGEGTGRSYELLWLKMRNGGTGLEKGSDAKLNDWRWRRTLPPAMGGPPKHYNQDLAPSAWADLALRMPITGRHIRPKPIRQ